jgi:hypothetical protein
LAAQHLVTINYVKHACETTSLTRIVALPEDVTKYSKLITKFDEDPVLSLSTPLKIDVAARFVNADATNCAIKEYKVKKFTSPAGADVMSTFLPSGSFDSSSGLLTITKVPPSPENGFYILEFDVTTDYVLYTLGFGGAVPNAAEMQTAKISF